MVAMHACKEAIWIMKICLEEGPSQRDIMVQCDSNNAIFLGKKSTFHVKREHIYVEYHFFMDIVEVGNVIKTGEHKKFK
jgi:hypothetical protein